MIQLGMPRKDWWIIVGLMLVTEVFFIIMILDFQKDLGTVIAIGWIWILFLLVIFCCILTALGRTIILNNNGCTVKFLAYEKHYSWDKLKVKRVEYTKNTRYSFLPTDIKTQIFAPYQIKKPKWLFVVYYSIVRHPLSMIYLFLIPKKSYEEHKSKITKYYIYLMEEEAFFEKMKEWNVSLESLQKSECNKMEKDYMSKKAKNIIVSLSVIFMLIGIVLGLATHEMQLYMPFVIVATILAGIEKFTRKKE